MFQPSVQARFPFLIAYLRRGVPADLTWIARAGPFLAGLAFLPLLLTAAGFLLRFGTPFTVLGSVAWLAIGLFVKEAAHRYAKRYMATEGRAERQFAYGAVRKMRQMHASNRLHRDLSEATLTLLEEIVRLRAEIEVTVNQISWRRPDLSERHQAIRAQSLDAADDAVLDAFSQFHAALPDKVEPRKIVDYVAEFFERLPNGHQRVDRFAEPGFDRALQLAQSLQELCHQLKQLELRVDGHAPGPAVDPRFRIQETLTTIQALQQAEAELRHHS